MAQRRQNPYAKACCYGTDGTSALIGSSLAAPRPLQRMPGRQAARGLRVPVWMIALAVAGLVSVLCFTYLGLRADLTFAAKQISTLQIERARTREINAALEQKIAAAGNPERIQSLAVNRLGMYLPGAEDIVVLRPPAPYVYEGETLVASLSPPQ